MDLSIIIPTLNRASFLEITLESLARQKKPDGSFEVVVIDNGSTDGTREVCKKFNKQFSRFIYDYDDVPGQLTGRHKGLKISSGDLLSFLDDDVETNAGWIDSVLQLSRKHPDISIFGGPSLPKYAIEPPAWLNRFWEPTPYGGKMCLPLSLITLDCDECIVDPLYVFGLNFSIRRQRLLELGGFHPDCIPSQLQHFQGDGETGLAIKAGMNNVKALHSHLLLLHHQVPAERLTAAYFKKWSFYNGVCQSFTDLRYNNLLYQGQASATRRKGLFATLENLVKKVRGALVTRFGTSAQLTDIIEDVHDSYRSGYAFHQQAFQTDPRVKDWVLRSDYLDYSLPQ